MLTEYPILIPLEPLPSDGFILTFLLNVIAWLGLIELDEPANILWLNPSKDRSKLVYKIWAVFGQISRLWYHLTANDTFLLFSKIIFQCFLVFQQ